jgi:sulfate transport system substrate-binding protein
MTRISFLWLHLVLIIASLAVGCSPKSESHTLLNVSYDPTRELYTEYNEAFAKHWQEQTGESVAIDQSHGGSGKQARSVIDGNEADVVTLALAHDIDIIAEKGKLLDPNWQEKLPNNSSPYTSTIVFLVRKGNPKQIKDWSDLVQGDVQIVTPNPKTSGGARWIYLAAWGYSLKQQVGDLAKLKDLSADERSAADDKAREFVTELFKRVPVLDSGARGATNTFVQRNVGDVLLTWENEAHLVVKDLGSDKVDLVIPSFSILAEPPVAVVDKNVAKHGTAKVAQAYLEYLYSKEGQTIVAKNHYRPSKPELVSTELTSQFEPLELFTVKEVFGSWTKAQHEHFDDGGVFDQIYVPEGK